MRIPTLLQSCCGSDACLTPVRNSSMYSESPLNQFYAWASLLTLGAAKAMDRVTQPLSQRKPLEPIKTCIALACSLGKCSGVIKQCRVMAVCCSLKLRVYKSQT